MTKKATQVYRSLLTGATVVHQTPKPHSPLIPDTNTTANEVHEKQDNKSPKAGVLAGCSLLKSFVVKNDASKEQGSDAKEEDNPTLQMSDMQGSAFENSSSEGELCENIPVDEQGESDSMDSTCELASSRSSGNSEDSPNSGNHDSKKQKQSDKRICKANIMIEDTNVKLKVKKEKCGMLDAAKINIKKGQKKVTAAVWSPPSGIDDCPIDQETRDSSHMDEISEERECRCDTPLSRSDTPISRCSEDSSSMDELVLPESAPQITKLIKSNGTWFPPDHKSGTSLTKPQQEENGEQRNIETDENESSSEMSSDEEPHDHAKNHKEMTDVHCETLESTCGPNQSVSRNETDSLEKDDKNASNVKDNVETKTLTIPSEPNVLNCDHNKEDQSESIQDSQKSSVYKEAMKRYNQETGGGNKYLQKDNKRKWKKIFLETLVANIKKEPEEHKQEETVKSSENDETKEDDLAADHLKSPPKKSRRKAKKPPEKIDSSVKNDEYLEIDLEEYMAAMDCSTKTDQENSSLQEIVVECPSGLKTAILELKSPTEKSPPTTTKAMVSLLTGNISPVKAQPLSVLNAMQDIKCHKRQTIKPYQQLLPIKPEKKKNMLLSRPGVSILNKPVPSEHSKKIDVINNFSMTEESQRPFLKSLLTGEILHGKNSSVQPALTETKKDAKSDSIQDILHRVIEDRLVPSKQGNQDQSRTSKIDANGEFEKEYCIFARKWKHGYRADKYEDTKQPANKKVPAIEKTTSKKKKSKSSKSNPDLESATFDTKSLLFAHLVNKSSNDQGANVYVKSESPVDDTCHIKPAQSPLSYMAMMMKPELTPGSDKKKPACFGNPKDWKIPNPFAYHVSSSGLSGGSMQMKVDSAMDLSMHPSPIGMNKWQQSAKAPPISNSGDEDEGSMQALDLSVKKSNSQKCLALRKKCDVDKAKKVDLNHRQTAGSYKKVKQKRDKEGHNVEKSKKSEAILNIPVLPWRQKTVDIQHRDLVKEENSTSKLAGVPDDAMSFKQKPIVIAPMSDFESDIHDSKAFQSLLPGRLGECEETKNPSHSRPCLPDQTVSQDSPQGSPQSHVIRKAKEEKKKPKKNKGKALISVPKYPKLDVLSGEDNIQGTDETDHKKRKSLDNDNNSKPTKRKKNSKNLQIEDMSELMDHELKNDLEKEPKTPVGVIYNSLLTGKVFVAWDMPKEVDCKLSPEKGAQETVARPDGSKVMLFELGGKNNRSKDSTVKIDTKDVS